MTGNVPWRALTFGLRFAIRKADITQHMVGQFRQRATLAVQIKEGIKPSAQAETNARMRSAGARNSAAMSCIGHLRFPFVMFARLIILVLDYYFKVIHHGNE